MPDIRGVLPGAGRSRVGTPRLQLVEAVQVLVFDADLRHQLIEVQDFCWGRLRDLFRDTEDLPPGKQVIRLWQ